MKESNEIDISSYFRGLDRFTRKLVRRGFDILNFGLKYWYVILILGGIGIGLGYFQDKNTEVTKESSVLLQVNYSAASYAYLAAETIQKKLEEGDAEFFKELGLNQEAPELLGLTLSPIINIKDVVENTYDFERGFESILRNVEFDFKNKDSEPIPLYETFISDYKYHRLDLSLSKDANTEIVTKVIAYLNASGSYSDLVDENVAIKKNTLFQYRTLLKQADSAFVEELQRLEDAGGRTPGGSGYYVENENIIPNLLRIKLELNTGIRDLREELLYADKLIKPMNQYQVSEVESSTLDKSMVRYPIYLVGAFLLLAFARFAFFELKSYSGVDTES